jgi:hypothetical protein
MGDFAIEALTAVAVTGEISYAEALLGVGCGVTAIETS